jgi:spore maturation protein CgeB
MVRLLKIGIYPPAYLEMFYSGQTGLSAEPYVVQHSRLIGDFFGTSDFWTRNLRELGYEAIDIVANCRPLQNSWAREQAVPFEADWLFRVSTAQIQAFGPDVLIIADYQVFDAQAIRQIRSDCPSVRLVLGWCGAPFHNDSVFNEWDIVLSCVPDLVSQFRKDGHLSYHVNHAFERRVLDNLTDAQSTVDFSFIGNVVKAPRFHEEREKILLQLIERTPLQIWSDIKPGGAPQLNPPLTRKLAYSATRFAPRIGVPARIVPAVLRRLGGEDWLLCEDDSQHVDPRLAGRAHPPVFGREMFQKLRDSKVTLNTHIDISRDSASNMRLFEATGVGACLLTDWKGNIAQLFEPDTEVLTYRNVDECVEKLHYLLEHDDQRRSIAASGQRRVLRDHTFAHRAMQIDEVIREAL